MNNTMKSSLHLSAIVLVGAAIFMTACGPEDMAQINDNASITAAEEMDMNKDMAKQPIPMAVKPQAAVQLPNDYLRMPTRVVSEPTIVTNTGEERAVNRDVLIEKNVHVLQPSLNRHLINTNYHTNYQYKTNIVRHPSFANQVVNTATATSSAQVLPTTEETAEAVVGPAVNVGYGYGFGHHYGCAPWLSGGFHRFCRGAVAPYLPGPYLR